MCSYRMLCICTQFLHYVVVCIAYELL